jgi:hypothetical protein
MVFGYSGRHGVLEPSVSPKNAKNQYAVLPGISVRVLASHFSSVIETVLLYIFIKQRQVQTFWGIIHVCQALLETGSGPKLSHNCCTAGNFDLHDHGLLLLTWSSPVGSNKTIYLCFHPLPVPMAARITKYLNKYMSMGICLIYMSRTVLP